MANDTFNPRLLHQYLNVTDSESPYFNSPIYSELSTVEEHFSDKEIHSTGGMKVISKVNDLRSGRSIAMAEMKLGEDISPAEAEKFLREARLTASLEHPNIVPIYDIGLNELGQPFFTMKFMKDEDLTKIIRELVKVNPSYTRKYSLNKLLDIFIKVCDAVSYAHSKHVVHLDIKPSNIMIGDCGEVYICDWGLAKILQVEDELPTQEFLYDEAVMKDITLTGEVKGTPGYMAPEQIDTRFGDKNETTDIYALGALLYTILTLKRPYAKLSVTRTIKATTRGKLPHPKDITYRDFSDSLDAVCMKAMALEQEDRYNAVEELVNDIRSYQEGFITEAESRTTAKSLFYLLKRNRLLATMLILVVLTGVGVGAIVNSLLGDKLRSSREQASEKLQLTVADKEQEIHLLKSRLTKQINTLELQNRLVNRKLTTAEKRVEHLFTNSQSIRGSAVVVTPKAKLQLADIPFTTGTFSFWFYARRTGYRYPYLFQLGESRWHLDDYTNSGGLVVDGGSEYIAPVFIGGPLWNQWHHFTVTVDSEKNMIFYVDGIEVKLKTRFRGSRGLALGTWLRDTTIVNSMDGHFDEVSVWSKVLTPDEIKRLAKTELFGDEEGLEAYYKFERTTTDSTKNNYDLEIIGNVTFKP